MMNDRDLADRVRLELDQFETNSVRLQEAAENHLIYLISKESFAISRLTEGELKKLYSNQVASIGRPAREFYDEILLGARQNRCSYCQYGAASTLDHFIPKDKVPGLAIDPWNLIPCCWDCNHRMLSVFRTTPDTQALHPYALPNMGRWLRAVLNSDAGTVSFFVETDSSVDSTVSRRISQSFDDLGLAALYSKVSGADLAKLNQQLGRYFPSAHEQLIREHLSESARQEFSFDSNSREGAMLEALAGDDWYCAGGFAIL
ncbi:HNH endonuclease [Rathayibacter sp. VKM Ac-2857]|nr:HNH endonuclease [Rathayibacter sp. VKM Ac-2857]